MICHQWNAETLSTLILSSHPGIWLEKSFLKKFQDCCPPTENIATRFAESTPSLKNLRPIPGAVVILPVSGSKARDSLKRNWCFVKILGGKRSPCQPMLSALEYSRVGMATKVPPSDFANHPHRVDWLQTIFPVPILGKLVTRSPDDGLCHIMIFPNKVISTRSPDCSVLREWVLKVREVKVKNKSLSLFPRSEKWNKNLVHSFREVKSER